MKAVARIILALLLLCGQAQAMAPWQLPQPDVMYMPAQTDLYYYALGAKKTDATFTRASAKVTPDHEGLLVRTPTSNEATFAGARPVKSLLAADSSEDFSVASWVKANTATVTGTNVLNFPAENDIIYQVYGTTGVYQTGKSFTVSVTLSGSGTISLTLLRASGTADLATKSVTLTSVPTRYSISFSPTASASTGLIFRISRVVGDTATTVTATNAGLYEVTGQTNQNPPEHVSTHTAYDGQSVKGVRYFSYENGNTVDANGIVTEAQGAAIAATTLDGYDYQPAATNAGTGRNAVGPDLVSATNIYASYDFTSGWTAVNATINDANTFTATIAGGYIYKTSVTQGKRYRVTVGGTISSGEFRIIDKDYGTVYLVGFGTVDFTARGTGGVAFRAVTNGAVVDITTLTMYEIQAANSSGTGVTGLGTGAKSTAANNVFPGITVGSADATSYAEIVSDTAAITTAKLLRLQPAGKTYKLVAAAGGALTFDITAVHTAATWTHSAYIRGATAADTVQLGGSVTGVGAAQALTTAYQLKSYTFTAQVGDAMRIQVPAGQTIYVTLFQAEAGTVPTSRIVTEGAAVARSRDALTVPLSATSNYRHAANTTSISVTFPFASTAIPSSGSFAILSTTTSATSLLYIDRSAGGQLQMNSTDGTNTVTTAITEWAAGDSIDFEVTASTVLSKLNNWNSVDGWGTATDYDGGFVIGAAWQFFFDSVYPAAAKLPRVLGTADPAGVQ